MSIIQIPPLTAICQCHRLRMYDCPDNKWIDTYTPEDIAEARRMVKAVEAIDRANRKSGMGCSR